MKVAKDAAVALLDSLSNVRVGVGSFARSWPYGLELDHPVADLDANRASIKTAIMGLRAWGGTPLVQTMQQTGRYFVGTGVPSNPGIHGSTSCTANGYYSGKLTLKPGRGDEKYVGERYRRSERAGIAIRRAALRGSRPSSRATCDAPASLRTARLARNLTVLSYVALTSHRAH